MEFTIDQALKHGIEAHKAGQVQEADRLYTAILKAQPKHPDANHNMGVLAVGVGKVQEALPFFKAALEANPATAQFWFSYIDALIKLDKLAEAKAVLDQAKSKGAKGDRFDQLETRLNKAGKEPLEARKTASERQPKQPNILDSLKLDQAIKLAKNKSKEGSSEEAKHIYQDILVKFPRNKKAIDGLKGLSGGTVGKGRKAQDPRPDQLQLLINLYSQGQPQQALEQATALLQKFSSSSILHNICGAVYQTLGKLDESVMSYLKAVAIKPNYADAYSNMGAALQTQGKLEEASRAFKKALEIQPNNANTLSNIGVIFKDKGQFEEAIVAYDKVLAIRPDSFDAYNKIGNVLQAQGKLEEAIDAYNKALSLRPDYAEAHHSKSIALLNGGRLKEGLDEYEWRWKTNKMSSSKRHFSQPLWDGQKNLSGKRILLWCEQGVGDTINWSSRLSLLASQAGHCILECQEKLVPLLSRSFPNVEVKSEDRSRDAKRDDFDFHLPMGSLHRHFIPEISQNAKADAFLVPDPVRVTFWRERLSSLGKGPYVGISWKSADMSPKRLPNYAALSEFSPILKLPNVTFINLQYIDFADDLSKIQNELGVTVHNFDDLDHYEDLLDVAALYAALDVVVSVQSAVPAISAGIGTCTKLALWRQSSWNNILNSSRGPLVDKFEKNTWEPWSSVFSLIAEDIAKLTISKS